MMDRAEPTQLWGQVVVPGSWWETIADIHAVVGAKVSSEGQGQLTLQLCGPWLLVCTSMVAKAHAQQWKLVMEFWAGGMRGW